MLNYYYVSTKNEVRSSLFGPAFQNFVPDLSGKQILVTFAA